MTKLDDVLYPEGRADTSNFLFQKAEPGEGWPVSAGNEAIPSFIRNFAVWVVVEVFGLLLLICIASLLSRPDGFAEPRGRKLPAVVSQISPEIDAATRRLHLTARVSDSDEQLRSNTIGTAEFADGAKLPSP